MPSIAGNAYGRDLRGLGLIFIAQLLATIVLCLLSVVMAAASFFAIMTTASKLGPEVFWPSVVGIVAFGGLIIGTLAWIIARAMGQQRAKASHQVRGRRSFLGAIQLAAPPIVYLFFAYGFLNLSS